MLILNNIDAGFLIAPETTQTNERFLGVQRIKIRYAAGDREFVYLPFVGDTLKLGEDFGRVAIFKTTMKNDPFGCGLPANQSQYQTNTIMDLGQVMRTSGNDSNMFSTKVVSMDGLANSTSRVKIALEEAMIFD
jgi:hypothetical protein